MKGSELGAAFPSAGASAPGASRRRDEDDGEQARGGRCRDCHELGLGEVLVEDLADGVAVEPVGLNRRDARKDQREDVALVCFEGVCGDQAGGGVDARAVNVVEAVGAEDLQR
jgi:hypothetical protein